MKNYIKNILKIIKHIESKFFLNAIHDNKIIIFLLKKILFFLIINIVIFLPSFFICKIIFPIIFFSILNCIFLIYSVIDIKIRGKDKEKLDKIIINTSIYKDDFINFLKNDIFFNLRFCFTVLISIFFYLLFIYLLLKILPSGLNFNQFLLIVSSFLVLLTFLIFTSFIIYYFINKDKKSVFSQIKRRDIKIKHIFIVFIFILFIIPLFFIFKNFFNLFINIIASSFISVLCSLLINTILSKIGLYNKSNWKYLVIKIKDYFINIKFKDNINNIFNLLKSFKIIYPLIFPIAMFILFTIINNFYEINLKTRFILSMIFSMFFTYPIINFFNKSNAKKNILKPYKFTVFIYLLFFIIIFISIFKINLLINENSIINVFKIFILPIVYWFNSLSYSINLIISSINYFFLFLIPIVFFVLFLINMYLYNFFQITGNYIDYKIRKKLTNQNPSIIFGDSISLYPFLFYLILNLIIITFISIEIKPLSEMFFNIFEKFEIRQVFNFQFYKDETSIYSFFNLILNVIMIFIIIRLIYIFLSSLLSHFILYSDEIIFYENKLLKKTILRVPLVRINYIIVKQNILEKIFDIGAIYIETIDKNGLIKIKGISSIKDKNILIMDKIKSGLQKIQ